MYWHIPVCWCLPVYWCLPVCGYFIVYWCLGFTVYVDVFLCRYLCGGFVFLCLVVFNLVFNMYLYVPFCLFFSKLGLYCVYHTYLREYLSVFLSLFLRLAFSVLPFSLKLRCLSFLCISVIFTLFIQLKFKK